MKPNIMRFINQLEGYKTAIKVQHWSSKNMSMHKLFDDIASSVSDIQDMVSEISQGLYGQIKNSELKPISYKINGEQKFLDDILKDSKTFYSTIQKGDDFIGIRSEIETFIGKISQFKYLMNLCLKEDFKRNFKAKLYESKHTVRLSENELANYITECVQKSLDRIQGKKKTLNEATENCERRFVKGKKRFKDEFENEILLLHTVIEPYKEENDAVIRTIKEILELPIKYYESKDYDTFYRNVYYPMHDLRKRVMYYLSETNKYRDIWSYIGEVTDNIDNILYKITAYASGYDIDRDDPNIIQVFPDDDLD